jgi:hypothetical protein
LLLEEAWDGTRRADDGWCVDASVWEEISERVRPRRLVVVSASA